MGTSGYLDDWGCLNIDGTVVLGCFDDLIPANGYVKIPEGATKIEELAFGGCESLTSVTIPEGVTSIGERAFVNCRNLEAVALPRSVREIRWMAFRGCECLTVYYAGKEVHWRSIGVYTIKTWRYDNGSTRYETEPVFEPGTRVQYDWQRPAPTFAAKFRGRTDLTSAVIPAGTTYIRPGEYENCTNLRSVTIPEGVTSIKDRAFCGCESLRSVVIPRSVTEIGNDAFWGCENLTIYYGGSVWSKVHCGNDAFKDGLPVYCDWQGPAPDDDEQRVGAFAGRTDLTSAVIPAGTTYIRINEYMGCVNLKSVVIPRGVTAIYHAAFCECRGLTSVTIPDGVTIIGDEAFQSCNNLRCVAIPKSVTRIGNFAFHGSYGLTVYYGGSEADWKRISRGDVAFNNNTRIQYNWQGPAPGDEQRAGAFKGRERPPRKQAAGGGTARGAGGFDLTNMTIPDGTTEIRPYAFMGCATLESVVIPDSVTRIGENAFAGCSRLASVTLSKSVAHIGTDAFSGCPLKELHYGGGKDEWLAITGDRPRSKGIKVNLYPKGLPS